MVLVDSSVWLTALDSSQPESFKARIQLEELLRLYMVSSCEFVRFEVLQQIVPENRTQFLSYFNQLPLIDIKSSTWNIALQISWEVARRKLTLDLNQSMVVALALQNRLPLFTYNDQQSSVADIRKLKLLQ